MGRGEGKGYTNLALLFIKLTHICLNSDIVRTDPKLWPSFKLDNKMEIFVLFRVKKNGTKQTDVENL